MSKFYLFLYIPVFVLFCLSTIFYFDFTAEDAYITYRYAENLVNNGSLVYNIGEPINALTSPLHALISSVLFYTTSNTVISNKIFSMLLVLISVFVVWYRFRNYPLQQILVLALLLLAPCVLLWTFGGLETPLLLFLITITVIFVDSKSVFSNSRLIIVCLLGALSFLTRYDSVLFFAPLLIFVAMRAKHIKYILIALSATAILPLSWLLLSFFYYGDIFPTSYYIKSPATDTHTLFSNGSYIFYFLIYTGVIPVLVLFFVLHWQKQNAFHFLHRHFREVWWIYLGLLLELIYGLTMATHHMMFSFRFFVPYLPTAVIIVLDLLRYGHEKNEEVEDRTIVRTTTMSAVFTIGLLLFQLYQIRYTFNSSVNGISSIGEYRSLSIRDYSVFMHTLRNEAQDIESHWKVVNHAKNRVPRIFTYAGGMLPYSFRDSYIYTNLASYRYCNSWQNLEQQLAKSADYIHILVPRHGETSQQLPQPQNSFQLISSYENVFDGSKQKFLVFYNPAPCDNILGPHINDPCR